VPRQLTLPLLDTSRSVAELLPGVVHVPDWLDLDAPLLITNDPFDGVRYNHHARIILPDRPGIGVIRRTERP